MKKIFEGVQRILLTEDDSLEGLAGAVGLTVEELFEGESFAGVDLRDEPISVLRRIDADFTQAILTRPQQSALRENPGIRAERMREKRRNLIRDLRRDQMEKFIRSSFISRHHDAARKVLLRPFSAGPARPLEWRPADYPYVSEAIAFICERRDWLEGDLRGVLLRFLSLLRLFRFPLDSGVMDALPAGRIILDPEAVREVVDFDICTEGFVLAWLDQLKESPMDPINHRDLAGQMDPDTYGEALALAIHEPTSPPPSYYEKILDRARSFKELLWLSGHLRPKQINRETAGLLARLLARDATTSAQIKITAVADNLHPAVRSAFRYLVVAAGTPEGREALLEIIIEAGDKASGLEVDAIIGGLGFPESVELMRPRWDKLTPHHRSVAADAISAKATTPRERGQAERLKELHGRHKSGLR